MGTTELQVEQVIIGGVVLAAVLLPWAPEIRLALTNPEPLPGLATGAGLLYLAYVLGVVFDRLADTLTEWLDACQRLLFAREAERREQKAAARERRTPRASADPFPEDQLKIKALVLGGNLNAWVDYHRSRTRIARALAVYLPFVAWSTAIGMARFHPWAGPSVAMALVTPLAVSLMLLLAPGLNRASPVPKTYERTRHDAFLSTQGATLAANAGQGHGRTAGTAAEPGTLRFLGQHPVVLIGQAVALSSIAAAAGWERRAGTAVQVLAPTLIIAGVSTLAWWAWWRISWTYRTYLLQIDRVPCP